MPKKGNWGDWAIIEIPIYPLKKVSCYMCINYLEEDGSCAKTAHMPKKDGKEFWKKCDHFILGPEYMTHDIKEKVLEIKGKNYFTLKMQNKEGNMCKQAGTFTEKKPDKEFLSIQRLFPQPSQIDTKLLGGIQFNSKSLRGFRNTLAKYFVARNFLMNPSNEMVIKEVFKDSTDREIVMAIIKEEQMSRINEAILLLPKTVILSVSSNNGEELPNALSAFLEEEGVKSAPLEKCRILSESIRVKMICFLLEIDGYADAIFNEGKNVKNAVLFLDAFSELLAETGVLPIGKYQLEVGWLRKKLQYVKDIKNNDSKMF